jgi:hypothetical protein
MSEWVGRASGGARRRAGNVFLVSVMVKRETRNPIPKPAATSRPAVSPWQVVFSLQFKSDLYFSSPLL